MKNITHSIIGWCAGLALGITIGVSLNNIMLGIGLGVAFGAALGHVQMKKESFQVKYSRLEFIGLLFLRWLLDLIKGKRKFGSVWNIRVYFWNCCSCKGSRFRKKDKKIWYTERKNRKR